MSFSSNKNKHKALTTSSGTSTTTADPASLARVEEQSKGILDTGLNYTQQPFQKYTGQSVADLSSIQQQARTQAGANVGNYGGLLSDAEGAAQAGVEYDAADPSRFYNKYENDVINASGAYFDEQLAHQLNQQADSVAQRSAWGNSSRELGEAELRRTATMDKARAMAEMKHQGYRDAVDTGFRQQQGQYQGASIFGDLAGQKQQLAANDVAMLESLGATSRQIEQLKLDAARAEFDREAADRLQKTLLELQIRQGILGATPMGQTTTQSGTGTNVGTSTSSGFQFAPSFSIGGGAISFGGGKT